MENRNVIMAPRRTIDLRNIRVYKEACVKEWVVKTHSWNVVLSLSCGERLAGNFLMEEFSDRSGNFVAVGFQGKMACIIQMVL